MLTSFLMMVIKCFWKLWKIEFFVECIYFLVYDYKGLERVE